MLIVFNTLKSNTYWLFTAIEQFTPITDYLIITYFVLKCINYTFGHLATPDVNNNIL